jgi:ubiquinol-cytochrome c reductase cytochrome b subunit
MLPHGEFVEVHEELTAEEKFTLTQHEQPRALEVEQSDSNGVTNPNHLKQKLRARFSQAHVEQVPAPSEADVKALEEGGH